MAATKGLASAKISEKRFKMAGTENTGNYIVVGYSGRGRIGIRVLSGNAGALAGVRIARIRVEPTEVTRTVAKVGAMLTRQLGWKQVGDDEQHRFSIVHTVSAGIEEAVVRGIASLGVTESLVFRTNPNAPQWLKDLVEVAKSFDASTASEPEMLDEVG